MTSRTGPVLLASVAWAALACAVRTQSAGGSQSTLPLVRPTIVVGYTDLWREPGTYIGGTALLVDTTAGAQLPRNHQCVDGSQRVVTDSVGIVVLPARRAPRATRQGDRICLPGRELAIGAYYATLTLFEVPRRAWHASDTLWLECVVHTGQIGCEPIAPFRHLLARRANDGW